MRERELDLLGMMVLPILSLTMTRGIHVADVSAVWEAGAAWVSTVCLCSGLISPECVAPLPGF